MRLSLGGKDEREFDSGSGGVDLVFSWVDGFAGSLPVVSCVLAFNSLIINDVSFSGISAVLLVVWGLSLLGCRCWFWRNAFLSPSNVLSGFADSLPVVSRVFGSNSLIINKVSFFSIGWIFSTMEAWMAWSSGLVFSVVSKSPKCDIMALRILSDHLLVSTMCILGLGSGVSSSGSKNLEIMGSVVSLAMVSA